MLDSPPCLLPADVSSDVAERCAAFLIDEAQRLAGRRAWQGKWDREFPMPSGYPALQALAQRRLFRVPFRAVRSLCAWAHGCPVQAIEEVPAVARVLALQSYGSRCVSLLPAPAAGTYHSTPLEFAVHDLCHLDKFLEPELYGEQVGFFAQLHQLLQQPSWCAIESELDLQWQSGRERVAADMNGSTIYLFAMLKMQLKLAARRQLARQLGEKARCQGNLSPHEHDHFTGLQSAMFDALGWPGEVRDAGDRISARRDCPQAAVILRQYFHGHGLCMLQEVQLEPHWQWIYQTMLMPVQEAAREQGPSDNS